MGGQIGRKKTGGGDFGRDGQNQRLIWINQSSLSLGHAEPSAVATARAVATASDDGESSGVDELLANFVLEDEDEIHRRRGW